MPKGRRASHLVGSVCGTGSLVGWPLAALQAPLEARGARTHLSHLSALELPPHLRTALVGASAKALSISQGPLTGCWQIWARVCVHSSGKAAGATLHASPSKVPALPVPHLCLRPEESACGGGPCWAGSSQAAAAVRELPTHPAKIQVRLPRLFRCGAVHAMLSCPVEAPCQRPMQESRVHFACTHLPQPPSRLPVDCSK